MSLDKCFNQIETLEFQAQYSIYSSFSLMHMEMSEDNTLKQLIAELVNDSEKVKVKIVCRRIGHLLDKSKTNTEVSYDETIAAYLFCLSRVDLAAALDASDLVLGTGSLWWSVQLALYVRNYTKQITDSITASSKASVYIFDVASEKETSDFDTLESLSSELEELELIFDTEDHKSTPFNFFAAA